MAAHIDVFKNDWSNGVQELVARVTLRSEGLHIQTFRDDGYDEIVRRPIHELESGRMIHSSEEPEKFFEALPGAFRGSYLSATSPHDHDCPFEAGVVPFEAQDLKSVILP